jgi:multiple sugar transport system ATP-binding protein
MSGAGAASSVEGPLFMASVALRGVSKRFGSVTAVSGVSLDVRDGEFMVLLGPSGCGKSTVLRMIAGLETPSDGSILIGERSVERLSPKDRDVAMVFQNYALYPHMSVYDNMAFGLKMRKTPRPEIDRRVRDAAELLGIAQLLQRKPRELSGGERQRVALARAIVREPQVFLMDEPLSNLDAQLRVQTRAELVKLQRRLSATVIYVTHDQTEAMTMADRVAVMRGGLLQQVDGPQQIYDVPANRFVAGFVGSPGMNFFPGRLVEDGPATSVDAGFFRMPLPSNAGFEAPAEGLEVVVGARPEDVLVSEASATDAGAFEAAVDVIEPLGSEKLLHIVAGDVRFVARVDPRLPVEVGQQLWCAIRPGRSHLFDATTGARLAIDSMAATTAAVAARG